MKLKTARTSAYNGMVPHAPDSRLNTRGQFLAARRYARVSVSYGSVSVCLSHAGCVSKRLHGLSWFLHNLQVSLDFILNCVLRKLAYFFLKLCPKFCQGTSTFAKRQSTANTARRDDYRLLITLSV